MFSAIGHVVVIARLPCPVIHRFFARPPDQCPYHARISFSSTGTGTMLHPFHLISCFFTRRVLARLLSTFLCCLTLVVKPCSQFGGPSAFLLLTLKELVFS